jgi:hypothetical protein
MQLTIKQNWIKESQKKTTHIKTLWQTYKDTFIPPKELADYAQATPFPHPALKPIRRAIIIETETNVCLRKADGGELWVNRDELIATLSHNPQMN